MLKAFDTSVLIAALSSAHLGHEVARSHLDGIFQGDHEMAVSTHALAECYATLIVLQVRPRISPEQARHLIKTNVLATAATVSLGRDDYEEALTRVTRLGLTSGTVYDALHVVAAEKVDADQLLTFNGQDFRRMPPEGPTDLVVL